MPREPMALVAFSGIGIRIGTGTVTTGPLTVGPGVVVNFNDLSFRFILFSTENPERDRNRYGEWPTERQKRTD